MGSGRRYISDSVFIPSEPTVRLPIYVSFKALVVQLQAGDQSGLDDFDQALRQYYETHGCAPAFPVSYLELALFSSPASQEIRSKLLIISTLYKENVATRQLVVSER